MNKRRRDSIEADNHSPKRVAKPQADTDAPANSSTLQDLARLLDLTDLTSHDDILDRFGHIAHALLTQFRLCVTVPAGKDKAKRTEYDVRELEFYLRKSGCHDDPFTHASEEQKLSGRWYFHRTPTFAAGSAGNSSVNTAAGAYRSGSRKGLDLTFGIPVQADVIPAHANIPPSVTSRHFAGPDGAETSATTTAAAEGTSGDPPVETRGGILLRTIRRVSDGKLISGPSLLVDEILRASGAGSIVELIDAKWEKDTRGWVPTTDTAPTHASLHWMPMPAQSKGFFGTVTKTKPPTVYSSPRIGLDLSHSSIPAVLPGGDLTATMIHPRVFFIQRSYRFFTHPDQLTANGRGHTFIAVYDRLQADKAAAKHLKERLAKETGLKAQTVDKYLDEYQTGEEMGREKKIAAFLGANGKGAGSSAPTALKMFGALRAVEG